MEQLVLSLIFLGLGIGLYRNKVGAARRFALGKQQGILFSQNSLKVSYKWLFRGQLLLTVLMAVYLLLGMMRSLGQGPLLVMLLLFLAVYYGMHYCVNEEWFFDEGGLWSSHQRERIGFENIVGYEWRDYQSQLILRVRYKGKGIMLLSSDYEVQIGQKGAITKLLNERMAGI